MPAVRGSAKSGRFGFFELRLYFSIHLAWSFLIIPKKSEHLPNGLGCIRGCRKRQDGVGKMLAAQTLQAQMKAKKGFWSRVAFAHYMTGTEKEKARSR